MKQYQAEIDKAEKASEEGDIDLLRKLLPPLLEKNIPEAIRINASFFDAGTPEEECDRLYVEGMFRAAELGDLKAKYRVGALLDIGECGVEQDKVRASNIFKELAELGDPHCMWIYACELIWGEGSFPISTEKGLELLNEAARKKSSGACMTIAKFHNDGSFSYEQSIEERDKFRFLAIEYDETTFDPYS